MRILIAGIALYALYLPVALFVGSFHVPIPRPPGTMTESLKKILQGEGFAYLAPSTMMPGQADASEDNMRSPVMLYEDLKPLGPALSYVRDIQSDGRGRFNFVKFTEDTRSFVIFSTSDNSDPRSNGRHYWLVLP